MCLNINTILYDEYILSILVIINYPIVEFDLSRNFVYINNINILLLIKVTSRVLFLNH